MKKIIILTSLLFVSLFVKAQNESVEKSTFGFQTGFLGIWIHNEAKLSKQIALRSELGLNSGIYTGEYYKGLGFVLAPVITLEPRWYYNLKKRAANSKNIEGNSGNFISIMSSYNPSWFTINNNGNEIADQISIIPTWGMKRNYGKHLTYETGIGFGYRYIFYNNVNESEAALNIHLRIGYRF